jgi:hypothetical protein
VKHLYRFVAAVIDYSRGRDASTPLRFAQHDIPLASLSMTFRSLRSA